MDANMPAGTRKLCTASEAIKGSKDQDAPGNKSVGRPAAVSSLLYPQSCTSTSDHRSEDVTMAPKGILKTEKKDGSTTQSSSICAVRWTLPKDDVQVHSSVPSRPTKPTNQSQQHPRQKGLKDLRTLHECVRFIQRWKEQVDQVCKEGRKDKQGGSDPQEGNSKTESHSSDQRNERSLEESRKLILEWAAELRHVDKLLKNALRASEGQEDILDNEDPSEAAQLRIMEWAKELQTATENCGVSSEDLVKMLRLLALKKKRLVNLLPLLEFITWSLLREDSTQMIPQLWLLSKQRTWKAGIPRYIPKSVWSWICSASADVVLDPMTSHPWLQLSDDQRMVQEGLSASEQSPGPQRFDSWPCVLGWEGYGSGRHYWEVKIANKGYWRVGLASADSKRQGRFSMTPKDGFWTVWRSTHQFYACTKPETPLPAGLIPQVIGVYLDYEEGQISFYNAETKSHIYTFTGTFRGKLYPLFAPLDGRTLMTIIPPQDISAK